MKSPHAWLPLIGSLLFCSFMLSNCQETPPNEEEQAGNSPDFELIKDSLAAMVELDQAIQFAHLEEESPKVRDSLYRAQDSIFQLQSGIVKEMFERYGFLDTTMVGESGSYDFWLLVQHADHDPDFQRQVLKAMAPKVEAGIADPSNFAYLTDRVRKNNGEKILYGTQVQYTDDFWVIPYPLKDSLNVNERRAAVDLEPIEVYLNSMMEFHFQMNEKIYRENGLDGPNQYPIPAMD